MADWKTTKLGDRRFFKIRSSGVISFEGKKDYLSTSSVDGTSIVNIEEEVKFSNRPSRANMQPVPNSVWFAKMKNTLKVLFADEYLINRTILSTGYCGIELEKFDPEYFFQFLLSHSFNVQKNYLAEGSTQEAINNSKIKNIKISYPNDITEQHQIANILTAVDKAIVSSEKIIAKYKRIKNGLINDVLTRGIDKNGNLRSYDTHQFKESVLGRIPKDWVVYTLKRALIESKGYIQTGPFGSQLHSHEYTIDGTVPVIMPQDINETSISLEKIAKISEAKANNLSKHRVLKNDIIFARRGDISRIAVITEQQKGWFCGTGCILLRTEKIGIIDPTWFTYFYKSFLGQNQINANAVGLMMVNLNSSVLNNLLMFKLPYEEQNRIVLFLGKVEKMIESKKNNLLKLHSIKTGLMQDLLSGKVRLSEELLLREGIE